MTKLAKGQPQPPKFLSTHPEDADRQQRLMTHIPEVLTSLHVKTNVFRPRKKQPNTGVRVAFTTSKDLFKIEGICFEER